LKWYKHKEEFLLPGESLGKAKHFCDRSNMISLLISEPHVKQLVIFFAETEPQLILADLDETHLLINGEYVRWLQAKLDQHQRQNTFIKGTHSIPPLVQFPKLKVETDFFLLQRIWPLPKSEPLPCKVVPFCKYCTIACLTYWI
jgi:hypothetical protein